MFLKNLKMSQKLFFGFGMVTLLTLSVFFFAHKTLTDQHQAVEQNLHTYEVIREADGLLISLINMETGARGYAITGENRFMEPYNTGQTDYHEHFNKIKSLTSNNPNQQKRLAELQTNYERWFDWENNYIIKGRQKVLSGESTMEDLIHVAKLGTGKKEMDSIRRLLDQIVNEEQVLLDVRHDKMNTLVERTDMVMSFGGLFVIVLSLLVIGWITRVVVAPVRTVTNTFMEISAGEPNLEARLHINSKDEIGDMAKYFNTFIDKLRVIIVENKNQSWLKSGQAELNDHVREEQDMESLGQNIISFLANYVNAQIGAIYFKKNKNSFIRIGGYAYNKNKALSEEITMGEGLIGQAAYEKQSILMTDIPGDYIKVESGVGEGVPVNILIAPCIYNQEVNCVIELGTLGRFTDIQIEFIEQVSSIIAVSLHSAESRLRMKVLLDKTLQQSEELQVQQEELRQSNEELEEQAKALRLSEGKLQSQQEELRQNNEELEEQTKALKESEARLQSQQEELRVINEELEERTKSLEIQKNDISIKNKNLRNAQREIEEKAKALEIASKYKSEFLANMSHELRTPLNSILILSQLLSGKKDKAPLTDKQLEFAQTIYSSGQDLLKLINDVLDLSKVEAGKMEIIPEPLYFNELIAYLERSFRPMANQKGIDFEVVLEEEAPEKIISDTQRVQQIVNNLISNAFKFTDHGGVTLKIGRSEKGLSVGVEMPGEGFVSIAVSDTGIGIPKEKQAIVFEAFKQSDGTTSRKYGGTGLGLSISKELAQMLGGEVYLESEAGKGSTFTLVLPETMDNQDTLAQVAAANDDSEPEGSDVGMNKGSGVVGQAPGKDKRGEENKTEAEGSAESILIKNCGKTLLIIEDDKNFSAILADIARQKGYSCLTAEKGQDGLNIAIQYKPNAIILDIGLPDINGWALIEELSNHAETRNIPVHIISGYENSNFSEATLTVAGYLEKPVSLENLETAFKTIESVIAKPFKKILVLDEDKTHLEKITEILQKKQGLQIRALESGADALELLKSEAFDCIILDLKLRDISGIELLAKLRENNIDIPVMIHTEEALQEDQALELHKYAESIILKGARSGERLLDEVTLFLHDLDAKTEEKRINSIRSSQEKEASLKDKKILIVDDDMRNVFALSSILEEKGMNIIVGRNGREGLLRLEQNEGIDLVLMDIMMPEMDGYTAMREIRKNERNGGLPIIALTAKAMKDDKQKCIEAGADDYLVKPIDIDKLISMLRVWLYR